jgi:two-component system, sensor histidine kinase and response regulator
MAVSSISSHASRTSRILVADSFLPNRLLLEMALERAAYTVKLAEDGPTALRLLNEEPPDLVLLDAGLATMNGYDVAQQIRQIPEFTSLPILLMATAHSPDVFPVSSLGASDVLWKPIESDELLVRIRALLHLKRHVDTWASFAQQQEKIVAPLIHDLRTPLVATNQLLHLVQQGSFGELTPIMAEAIGTLERSNHHLLQMVNQLADVSRHKRHPNPVDKVTIDLRELIQDVVRELKPWAHKRQLELQLDIQNGSRSEHHLSLLGDRLDLYRLFINLIGNAIKFTVEGRVTVRLQTTQAPPGFEPASAVWVRLDVEDTGKGIAADERDQLLAQFHQGHTYQAGTGLGLYLVQQTIRAHDGTLEIRSVAGQGSLFQVYLPTPHVWKPRLSL